MTVETFTNLTPYPQTKLRINGTYHAGTVGEHVPAGQPETVEIELNEGLPADPYALSVFIGELVAALGRLVPAGGSGQATVTVGQIVVGQGEQEVRPL